MSDIFKPERVVMKILLIRSVFFFFLSLSFIFFIIDVVWENKEISKPFFIKIKFQCNFWKASLLLTEKNKISTFRESLIKNIKTERNIYKLIHMYSLIRYISKVWQKKILNCHWIYFHTKTFIKFDSITLKYVATTRDKTM